MLKFITMEGTNIPIDLGSLYLFFVLEINKNRDINIINFRINHSIKVIDYIMLLQSAQSSAILFMSLYSDIKRKGVYL